MYSVPELLQLLNVVPFSVPGARQVAERAIREYSGLINRQLGVADPPNAVVTLIYSAIDDSESMGKTQPGQTLTNGALVAGGHNVMIEALRRSALRVRMMVTCRTFNGGRGHGFTTVENADLFNPASHGASGQTPLYDQGVVGLVTLLVKAALLLQNNGVQASATALVIISDGYNEGSGHKFTAADFRILQESMVGVGEPSHLTRAVGVTHPGAPDYHRLFSEMGIPPECISEATASEHDMREMFNTVTESLEVHTRDAEGGGGGFATIIDGEEEDDVTADLPGVGNGRDGTTRDMPQSPFGGPIDLNDERWTR